MEDILNNSSFSIFKFDRKNYEATYMQNVTDLLAKYSWIYETRNIDVIHNNVLDKIPHEWVEVLSKILHHCKIRVLAYGYYEEDWPVSLKLFIYECKSLSDPRFSNGVLQRTIKKVDLFSEVLQRAITKVDVTKKTPAKKKEEVETMSHVVYKVSQAVHSNKVVDIGSGLGYLTDSLHKKYGICSIGLDSVPEYTSRATERLGKNVCHKSICYETLKVSDSEECLLALKAVLEKGRNLSCSCNSDTVLKSPAKKLKTEVKNTKKTNCGSKKDLLAATHGTTDVCHKSICSETLKVSDSEECFLAPKAVLEKGKNLSSSCNSDTVFKIPAVKWKTEAKNTKKTNRGSKKDLLAATHRITEQRKPAPDIMVGLHSCGKLFQDMMKIFCKLDELKTFICVGCCYHKVDIKDFPMSKVAMLAIDKTRTKFPSWQPCISGLRLGSDRTRASYRYTPDSKESIKYLFYRALLEDFIKKENIIWKQPKRHVREKELKSFSTYCLAMFTGHELCGNDEVFRKLNVLYEEKKHLMARVGILLILQTWLQPLWEAFITLDRVMYFRERNIRAEALALWEDAFSPRNLALCAFKNR